MRALLDTGTTATIIVSEFVVRADPVLTQRKEQSGKHLVEHSQQTIMSFICASVINHDITKVVGQ
jgi:hypothetical protein